MLVGALLLLRYAATPLLVGLAAGLLLLAAWPGVVLCGLVLRRCWLRLRPLRAGTGAVIVLGAPVPDGEVGPELAARLRGGLAVHERLRDGSATGAAAAAGAEAGVALGAAPLVLTGGRGDEDRPAEAVAMKRWVREQQPDSPVLVEDRATTTEENLLLATRLLGEHRVRPPYAVVTSGYHAARTSLLAARLGLDLQVVGVAVPAGSARGATLRELLIVLKEMRGGHAVAGAVVVAGAVGAALLA